ncbi:tetraspanin-20-like [Impatiens glandulifera]|uniref:tetraspanin-20-like n=1 Tax=Impatiens glandulifera TaxID=253017 RepID=UPI001FB0BDB5|nr:tetraspanin-20-like [Impatiens glandulifera]
MRTPCCHSLLASILKFFNFLQAFTGLSIILYSIYMLNQWNNHHPLSPPSSAPSPNHPTSLHHISPLNIAIDLADGYVNGQLLRSITLPDPWFIYAFMGLGIALFFVTVIGHIAAEVINGCCLCFYTFLAIVLFLLEAALVGFILIDKNWEKDLPFDSTGELDSFRVFVMDNIDICKWVAIALITVQALSLLISISLRAMVSTPKADDDIEDSYETVRVQTTHHNHVPGLTSSESKGAHSDIWSLRMKEKYGLKGGEVK